MDFRAFLVLRIVIFNLYSFFFFLFLLHQEKTSILKLTCPSFPARVNGRQSSDRRERGRGRESNFHWVAEPMSSPCRLCFNFQQSWLSWTSFGIGFHFHKCPIGCNMPIRCLAAAWEPMLILWASFWKSGHIRGLCVTYNHRFIQNYPDEERGIWREEREERNVATKI